MIKNASGGKFYSIILFKKACLSVQIDTIWCANDVNLNIFVCKTHYFYIVYNVTVFFEKGSSTCNHFTYAFEGL